MLRVVFALLAIAALVAPGLAQTEANGPSATDTLTAPPFSPKTAAAVTAAVESPATVALPDHSAPWRFDLLVGAPLAVRGQRQFGDSPYWFEAGAGLYLVFPMAFVGARMDTQLFRKRCHEIMLRPGIDVAVVQAWSFWGDEKTVGTVIADADLVWRRNLADGGSLEAGVKLGVGVPVTTGARGVFPFAGLLFGLTF